MEKKTVSSISGGGKTGELHVKEWMRLERFFTPYTKTNLSELKT